MSQDQLLAALSMDLRRVAILVHTESLDNAKTFIEEVRKRMKVIKLDFDPRINAVLKKLIGIINNPNKRELAEDALMYGTLLENYYVSRLNSK